MLSEKFNSINNNIVVSPNRLVVNGRSFHFATFGKVLVFEAEKKVNFILEKLIECMALRGVLLKSDISELKSTNFVDCLSKT